MLRGNTKRTAAVEKRAEENHRTSSDKHHSIHKDNRAATPATCQGTIHQPLHDQPYGKGQQLRTAPYSNDTRQRDEHAEIHALQLRTASVVHRQPTEERRTHQGSERLAERTRGQCLRNKRRNLRHG